LRGDECQTQERFVHSALFTLIMLGNLGRSLVVTGSRRPSWRRVGLAVILVGTANAAVVADIELSG